MDSELALCPQCHELSLRVYFDEDTGLNHVARCLCGYERVLLVA